MAQNTLDLPEISLLPAVPAWPTRKLPQERFDALVQEAMLAMKTMVEALNADFIPPVNAVIPYLDDITENLEAIKNAAANAVKAMEAAASAEAARDVAVTSAADARLSAASAANSAASAANDAASAATDADRAEVAAGQAEGYAEALDPVSLRLHFSEQLARGCLVNIKQSRRMTGEIVLKPRA